MKPGFNIYKDSKEEYRFRLVAKNGDVIAVSEGYKNIQACSKAIEVVKLIAVDAEIYMEE